VLEPQTGIPLNPTTAITAPFWDGCAEGELRYQRCADCGTANFTPTELCRGCSSRELAWSTSTGRGSVYTWTVVHRPVTPSFTTPYAVAIVDLDDGYRMLTNIIGIEPQDIHEGLRVRVDPHPVGGDRVLPYFRPDADGEGTGA
jgi:uncharacterized OB-fold protein